EVLGVAAVGVHDDYFELGGDSIQIVQLVAAARKAKLTFSVPDVLQHPTVAALAGAIDARRAPSTAVAPRPVESDARILVVGQGKYTTLVTRIIRALTPHVTVATDLAGITPASLVIVDFDSLGEDDRRSFLRQAPAPAGPELVLIGTPRRERVAELL